VVSTFRLFRDPPGADPTATVLLDSMIALATAQPEPKVAREPAFRPARDAEPA
jgi:hypothetical protein